MSLSDREPIKVVADIIKSELDLADGNIMLGFQKWNIPTPTDPYGGGGFGEGPFGAQLYIALSYLGASVIGNNNWFEDVVDVLTEVQEVIMYYPIQIDIMSFDSSARTRKEEVLQALASIFSQNKQIANQMQISRIPTAFNDASSLEETGFLQRYTITIAATALKVKRKAVSEFYETFNPPEVTVNE